jgi:hypothetical protein
MLSAASLAVVLTIANAANDDPDHTTDGHLPQNRCTDAVGCSPIAGDTKQYKDCFGQEFDMQDCLGDLSKPCLHSIDDGKCDTQFDCAAYGRDGGDCSSATAEICTQYSHLFRDSGGFCEGAFHYPISAGQWDPDAPADSFSGLDRILEREKILSENVADQFDALKASNILTDRCEKEFQQLICSLFYEPCTVDGHFVDTPPIFDALSRARFLADWQAGYTVKNMVVNLPCFHDGSAHEGRDAGDRTKGPEGVSGDAHFINAIHGIEASEYQREDHASSTDNTYSDAAEVPLVLSPDQPVRDADVPQVWRYADTDMKYSGHNAETMALLDGIASFGVPANIPAVEDASAFPSSTVLTDTQGSCAAELTPELDTAFYKGTQQPDIMDEETHHIDNKFSKLPTLYPYKAGRYTVKLSQWDGCTWTSDTTDVVFVPEDTPRANAGPDINMVWDGKVCRMPDTGDEVVTIDGSGSTSGRTVDDLDWGYQWEIIDYPQCTTKHEMDESILPLAADDTYPFTASRTFSFKPPHFGSYTVKLSLDNGCKSFDTVTVNCACDAANSETQVWLWQDTTHAGSEPSEFGAELIDDVEGTSSRERSQFCDCNWGTCKAKCCGGNDAPMSDCDADCMNSCNIYHAQQTNDWDENSPIEDAQVTCIYDIKAKVQSQELWEGLTGIHVKKDSALTQIGTPFTGDLGKNDEGTAFTWDGDALTHTDVEGWSHDFLTNKVWGYLGGDVTNGGALDVRSWSETVNPEDDAHWFTGTDFDTVFQPIGGVTYSDAESWYSSDIAGVYAIAARASEANRECPSQCPDGEHAEGCGLCHTDVDVIEVICACTCTPEAHIAHIQEERHAFYNEDTQQLVWPTIDLDGSHSSDPDPEEKLAYKWEVVRLDGDAEVAYTLNGAHGVNGPTNTFDSDQAGTYKVTLTVSDGCSADRDTIYVTVLCDEPEVTSRIIDTDHNYGATPAIDCVWDNDEPTGYPEITVTGRTNSLRDVNPFGAAIHGHGSIESQAVSQTFEFLANPGTDVALEGDLVVHGVGADPVVTFQPSNGADAEGVCTGDNCDRDRGTYTVKFSGTNLCASDFDVISVECICPKVAVAQIKELGCATPGEACTDADTAYFNYEQDQYDREWTFTATGTATTPEQHWVTHEWVLTKPDGSTEESVWGIDGFTWRPDAAGTYTVTLKTTEGCGTDTDSITVNAICTNEASAQIESTSHPTLFTLKEQCAASGTNACYDPITITSSDSTANDQNLDDTAVFYSWAVYQGEGVGGTLMASSNGAADVTVANGMGSGFGFAVAADTKSVTLTPPGWDAGDDVMTGHYTVELTVQYGDVANECSVSKDYVTVTTICADEVHAIIANPTTDDVGAISQVNPTGLQTGGDAVYEPVELWGEDTSVQGNTYLWTVTDSSGNAVAVTDSTTLNDAAFTPTGAGRFTITLTATDLCGHTDTATTYIDAMCDLPPKACTGTDTVWIYNHHRKLSANFGTDPEDYGFVVYNNNNQLDGSCSSDPEQRPAVYDADGLIVPTLPTMLMTRWHTRGHSLMTIVPPPSLTLATGWPPSAPPMSL